MAEIHPSNPELSILVVSYNTRELTVAAIRSVIAETRATSYEVLVVDNASSDGSAAAIAALAGPIRLIASGENLGFARANNLAAREARGAYLLLLNPDTVILDGAIDRLMSFRARTPEAGIWGGRTLFEDGSLNASSCWGRMTLWSLFCRAAFLTAAVPRHPVFNSEAYGDWDRTGERPVDIVSGCFLLISSSLWAELGGFDADFFMYGEDADLCLRARHLGAQPAITGAATIVHHGGRSERSRADKIARLLAAKAMLIERHFPRWQQRAGLALLAAWPLTRWLAQAMRGTLKPAGSPCRQEALVWRTVWRTRRNWLNGYPAADATSRGLPPDTARGPAREATRHAA